MFINDLPKPESVERELGAFSADYVARIEGNDLSAPEMILGCRCVLDLWIEGGGSSLDDEVIGVLGIESQCDHVMLRPGQRKPRHPDYDGAEDAEINRLGQFFMASFEREVRDLDERFNVC
jgi:hypothetical protein